MPFSIWVFVEKNCNLLCPNCQFLPFIHSSSPSSLSCSRPCRWPPSYTGISPVVQFDNNFDINVDLENWSQLKLWDCAINNWSQYEKPHLPTGNFAHVDRVNYDYVSFWKELHHVSLRTCCCQRNFPDESILTYDRCRCGGDQEEKSKAKKLHLHQNDPRLLSNCWGLSVSHCSTVAMVLPTIIYEVVLLTITLSVF